MPLGRRTLVGAVVALIAGGVYLRFYRPWQLTWGATQEEVARVLPGDDLVICPTFNATRAVTIDADPQSTWPWLVQMGTTRAGWYSYDLLDNLGRRSATAIIPELQHLAPGDVVPMSPDGAKGMRVHSVDGPRSMIWGTPGDTTWLWLLDPLPDGRTRLITRIRSRVHLTPVSLAFSALTEVADIWMMRRTLLNLRTRAERHGLASGCPIPMSRAGSGADVASSRGTQGLDRRPRTARAGEPTISRRDRGEISESFRRIWPRS